MTGLSSRKCSWIVVVLVLSWLSLPCTTTTAATAKASTKPNIIMIVIDDLGYDDMGYQTEQIQTPVMDKYRKEGQFLEWYYAQCVCSATRAALLSGRYPLHNGIDNWIPSGSSYGLPLNTTTIADVLHDNDYDTHAIGKWHIGFYNWRSTPTYRGFNSFYGYYSGGEDYYTHITGGAYDFHDDIGIDCGPNCSRIATEAHGVYSAFLYTDRAVEIITNHSTNADTKDTPLFLYLAYQSVHAPAECPQSYIDAYSNTIANAQRRKFAGMVSCFDEGIGNITDALNKYGYMDGNTILIFSADNGGPIPNDHGGDNIGSSNWPLRGGKHGIWEGGVRVTGVIWATPDLIPRAVAANTNYTQMMHVVDWFPTVMTAAGIDYTPYIHGYSLDGVDQWSTMSAHSPPSDAYFANRDTVYLGLNDPNGGPINDTALRYKWLKVFNGSGGWPFEWYAPPAMDDPGNGTIHYFDQESVFEPLDGTYPLYNLSVDPIEFYDISANNSETVMQLIQMMIDLQDTGVPQATNDKNCPAVVHGNSSVGPTWIPWCGV